MNVSLKPIGVVVLLSGLLTLAASGEQQAGVPTLDVLGMKAVPDGHYLLNLQLGSGDKRVNIEVKDNAGRSVASTDPQLRGLIGRFELHGNGVFLVSFHNDKHRATQWWFFRPDGSAVVKEIPDRGERQTAVPVSSDTLEAPAPRR